MVERRTVESATLILHFVIAPEVEGVLGVEEKYKQCGKEQFHEEFRSSVVVNNTAISNILLEKLIPARRLSSALIKSDQKVANWHFSISIID